ncbi:MAG TPA: hypothetical protein VGB03_02980 [Acidimicrobiales bacterium]
MTAILVVLALAAAGCSDDTDSDDEAADDTTTTSHEVGCTSEHTRREQLDPFLAPLLTVCVNEGRTGVRVVNNSYGVFHLATADPRAIVLWREEQSAGAGGFVDTAVRNVVPGGRTEGAFLLVPGASVIATGFTTVTLRATMMGDLSARTWASAALANWVQSRIRPGSALAMSVADCAKSVNTALRVDSPWEDQLRNAITGVPACRTVVNAVDEAFSSRRAAQAVDEIGAVASRSRNGWDDLARLVGKVATVFSKA